MILIFEDVGDPRLDKVSGDSGTHQGLFLSPRMLLFLAVKYRRENQLSDDIPDESAKATLLSKFTNLKLWAKAAIIAGPILVLVVALVAILIPREDDIYLGKLRDQKFGGYYASDAAAISKAKAICADLDAGGKNQGLKVEAVAVEVYCPEYFGGYRVLKPIKVEGTMTLYDFSIYSSSINNIGSWCWGYGGYSDIDEGTKVVITNQDGKRLAETALEQGSGGSTVCTFNFSFKVLEGEQEYLVEVGRRGESSYSEAELKLPDSVAVSLGWD